VARVLPWLVGGGAAAAGYLWWKQARRSAPPKATDATSAPPTVSPSTTPSVRDPLPGRWIWPVPYWNGRKPVISDGFDSPRAGLPKHGGVDIMYERIPSDSFKPGSTNGSRFHVMPDGVIALAASDGIIWQADKAPHGYEVVIDHSPRKVTTFYAHLEKLLVDETQRAASKQRVFAGQPIGFIGFSPLDKAHLRHLHFEVWRGGPNERIDPQLLMATWEISGAPSDAVVARNAGFRYRSIGRSGDAYPEWVRALKRKAGVYVIRDGASREILYVGSSTTQLYATITRHFQTWRRYKGFWRGQYGEGHDPGLTYDRGDVEVAIRLTSPSRALDEEARLIRHLKPRDNVLGAELDEVPF
jgi:hypothetical protein